MWIYVLGKSSSLQSMQESWTLNLSLEMSVCLSVCPLLLDLCYMYIVLFEKKYFGYFNGLEWIYVYVRKGLQEF